MGRNDIVDAISNFNRNVKHGSSKNKLALNGASHQRYADLYRKYKGRGPSQALRNVIRNSEKASYNNRLAQKQNSAVITKLNNPQNGALFNKNNAIYKATLNVCNSKNGDKILYDIDVVSINKKARSPVTSGLKTPRNDIKSQPNQNVKSKNVERPAKNGISFN